MHISAVEVITAFLNNNMMCMSYEVLKTMYKFSRNYREYKNNKVRSLDMLI